LQVQETLHYYLNGVAQNVPRTLNLDAAYTYDLEGKMTSVNYPETWSWQGQNGPLVSAPGPTYTYSFDTMDRPTGLKDQNNNTVVNNVSYNAANQLLTFNTETRTYNNLNQMTRLTITGTGPLDISYNFPAGANNGKISSQLDNLSGETVTYQYDSLNRLLSASSSQSWTETYGFDAFGNLLSKTGTGGAPTLSQAVSATTNRIMGQSYDSNGNQTTGPLGTVYYDAENRIAGVSSAGIQYASDSRNKRIWRGTLSSGNLAQQVYFYGVDGQKLGTYTFSLGQYGEGNIPEMTNSTVLLATFFGSKRIGTFDRLGTAKYNPNGQVQSFYPYGEDRGTVQPNDSLKFATYTRDAATGLDYADQRYYASNFGRFMSPDPYVASAGPSDPESWNRYAYTRGDPTNRLDFTGLSDTCPDCLDSVTAYAFRDSGGSAMGSAQGTNWAWVAMNFADTKGQLLPTLQGATPKQQNEFTAALKDAMNRLKKKKKCADDLGADAITTLLNANFTMGLPMRYDTHGNPVAPYDPGIYAATNVPNQTVTINLLGHFFNFFGTSPTGQQGAYNMNTGLGQTDFDAFVLLHELGHLNGVLGDDNKDPNLSDQFNEKILKDCFGVNWTPPAQ
jgi:RHS repeat-associated protein